MKKRVIWSVLIVVLVILSGVWLWQRQQTREMATSTNVTITASFYPLADFARQVGGGLVTVKTIVPAGSEPHDYEPTPTEIAQVYRSKIFLYNGSGVDPWAERVAADLQAHGVQVINMSDHVPVHLLNNQADPHFWLDPVIAQQEVQVITDTLQKVDPGHSAIYQAQAAVYQHQLTQLDQQYRAGLRMCTRRDIVTSHAALGYVAARYNLAVINIAGLSPEEEPSARRLSDIAQLVKQKGITHIFFETLVSPKLAQTLAQETGTQTIVFNPIEGLTTAEQQAGKNYISVMQDNLQNLRIALDCR